MTNSLAPLTAAQTNLFTKLVGCGALQLDFSGERFEVDKDEKRFSPYQILLGGIHSGLLSGQIADLLAEKIKLLALEPEVIFITESLFKPIALALIMKLDELFHRSVFFAGYRKGEEGKLFMAKQDSIKKKKIVVFADYARSGAKLFEMIENLKEWEVDVTGIITLLDVQEKTSREHPFSAFQRLRMVYNIPVSGVLKIDQLRAFLQDESTIISQKAKYLDALDSYLETWREPTDLSLALE